MKKISINIAFFALFALAFFGFSVQKASAMVPSLSLYSTGNNSVQITVNGDANSTVTLYYYQNASGSISSANIGSTNQNGYFNTALSANSYNIGQNSSVYVIVNGFQSNQVAWPYNNGNNNGGAISLSQSSLYLNSNQTSTVSIYGGLNSYYISSNSNQGAVSASINGNTVTVYGNYSGTANIIICSNNSNGGCATLYVSVNGNGNNNYNQYSPVTLNQNSVSVGVGQTVSVGVYGGAGIYYVSSNTNLYIASVQVNGNNINVYGRQIGSQTVVICSSIQNGSNYNNNNGYSYNSCANLIVNVVANTAYNYNYPYYTPTYIPVAPYASSVYLSRVPYTGAGLSPTIVTFLAYLAFGSAVGAYLVVNKKAKGFAA